MLAESEGPPLAGFRFLALIDLYSRNIHSRVVPVVAEVTVNRQVVARSWEIG